MAVWHEAQKNKLPQLHFKPESWVEPSDPEFLDQLVAFLESRHFNSHELVFSGFDGTPLLEGKPLPRKKGIYAMNLAGWKRSLSQPGKWNPGMYADGKDVKVIGLYDRQQLAEAYLPNHSRKDPIDEELDDLTTPVDLLKPTLSVENVYEPPTIDVLEIGGEIYEAPIDPVFRDEEFDIRDDDKAIEHALKGENLSDLPVNHIVDEGVLHRDYPDDPDASPMDALVGIVFYTPFQTKNDLRKGPQYRF